MFRRFVAALVASAAIVASLPAAAGPATPGSYDCQKRMAAPRLAPTPKPGEIDPWQCIAPKNLELSTAVRWLRDSLEYCRLTTGAYDAALRAAYLNAVRHGPKGWIVFMDADETVLDNSLYERERERCGTRFDTRTWDSWQRAGIAKGIPGAADFTQTVHALGGLIAIVTNRNVDYDGITQANLRTEGIWFDYEIGLAKNEARDKSRRWRYAVMVLSQMVGGSPKPVMWLGDQVTDFPIVDGHGQIVRAMSQQDAGKYIGVRYFLIPNPIYGNWMKNPPD